LECLCVHAFEIMCCILDCVGMDCVGMDCVGMDCVGMETMLCREEDFWHDRLCQVRAAY